MGLIKPPRKMKGEFHITSVGRKWVHAQVAIKFLGFSSNPSVGWSIDDSSGFRRYLITHKSAQSGTAPVERKKAMGDYFRNVSAYSSMGNADGVMVVKVKALINRFGPLERMAILGEGLKLKKLRKGLYTAIKEKQKNYFRAIPESLKRLQLECDISDKLIEHLIPKEVIK